MNVGGGGRSIAKAIGWGVAICGTLDILDALVFYWFRAGVTPGRLLRSIASVPLGATATHGGVGMAAVGLLIHYAIATFWVGLFVLFAQKIEWTFWRAVRVGALYGLVVYVCMNLGVLPVFQGRRAIHLDVVFVNAVMALVVFMGVGVALVNRRFAP